MSNRIVRRSYRKPHALCQAPISAMLEGAYAVLHTAHMAAGKSARTYKKLIANFSNLGFCLPMIPISKVECVRISYVRTVNY